MSGVPNPDYDPDWAPRYHALTMVAARLEAECDQLAVAAGFGSVRHRAALARHRQALAEAALVYRGRFRTIAAYAESRFAALPPAKSGASLIPDFDTFTSFEDVDAAFDRAARRAAENPLLDEMSLPVRQPAGLAAFAATGELISSWRRFDPAELGPGTAGSEPLDCLVTFQQCGDTFHICLAHPWGRLSPQSRDQFRNIATILARQTMIVALPEADIVFRDGNHALAEHRQLIRQVNEWAGKFRFYRHLLPRRDLKEQFCRVDMTWNGARFIDPDFSACLYESLPASLRAATEQSADSPFAPRLPYDPT